MDYYRNKLLPSDLYISKKPSQINSSALFEKLLQYLREKYSARLESIQNALNDFKKEVNLDAAIEVMKQSPITEKFLDVRVSEIFSNVLLEENEKTITALQAELGLKQAENLKLLNQIQSKNDIQGANFNQSHNFSHFNQNSQANYLNFNNLQNTGKHETGSINYFNRDKAEIEKIQEENEILKKELNKAREICLENEKLHRYCEQLEEEREKINGSEYKEMGKMIEAQKVAGIETLKEVQKRFKKKSKLLKKKIIEQKATIENLNQQISQQTSKKVKEDPVQLENLKKEYEKRETDLIEKHKQQIISLQYQYQNLLDNKVKEIESMINPKLKTSENDQTLLKINKELEHQNNYLRSQVSSITDLKNKNDQLELKNTELENSLLTLKSQIDLIDYKKKPAEIEKWQQEALLHEETKIKLKKLEIKFSETEKNNKSLEDKTKKLSDSLKLSETLQSQNKLSSIDSFKLKKLQNYIFLFKSQLSSLKNHLNESLISMKSEQHRKLIDLIRKIEKCSDQKSKNLIQENQKLTILLKSNSEAFDKLQEEVKSGYSKIKLKSQEKFIEGLKEVKLKYEKEIEEIKNENKRLHEMLEKANSTLMIDSGLNRQLKQEIDNLRTEKEAIRKKQILIEEKFQTQSNNFRNQLKNKQSELDLLKSSFNLNSS